MCECDSNCNARYPYVELQLISLLYQSIGDVKSKHVVQRVRCTKSACCTKRACCTKECMVYKERAQVLQRVHGVVTRVV